MIEIAVYDTKPYDRQYLSQAPGSERVARRFHDFRLSAETAQAEPDAPELRDRLVALRLQKTELDRDIARLQDNLQTGQVDLSPDKLKTLSLEMRRRLADGPPQLRQAYMKLILERATVDYHSVHLEGSPAVLEKLANRGVSDSSPEVLSFVQEWRPREDSN